MALRPNSSSLRNRRRAKAGPWLDDWASHFPGGKTASTRLRISGPMVVPGANILLDPISYVPGR